MTIALPDAPALAAADRPAYLARHRAARRRSSRSARSSRSPPASSWSRRQPGAMASELYIGLMSGTSVDGVDAVLADFGAAPWRTRARRHVAFDAALRAELDALQTKRCRRIASCRARRECADGLLRGGGVGRSRRRAACRPSDVAAVGLHGQTVRHRPELGLTMQLANPARLAEACGITVVADFRSRDVAAGGQGAPLAPALHAALFGDAERHRVVLNIGGIANVTDLPPARRGARLRHRTGQHAARRLVHAAPRPGFRPRRRVGGDGSVDRRAARSAARRAVFRAAAAEEHRPRPLQPAAGWRRGSQRRTRRPTCSERCSR